MNYLFVLVDGTMMVLWIRHVSSVSVLVADVVDDGVCVHFGLQCND